MQARTDVNRYKGAASDIVVMGRPYVDMVTTKRASGGILPKLGINNRTKSRTFLKAPALATITSLVAQRYAKSKAAGVKRKRGPDAADSDGQQEGGTNQRQQQDDRQHSTDQRGDGDPSSGAGVAAVMQQSCGTDPASVAARLAWLTTTQPLPDDKWDHDVAYDSNAAVDVEDTAAQA